MFILTSREEKRIHVTQKHHPPNDDEIFNLHTHTHIRQQWHQFSATSRPAPNILHWSAPVTQLQKWIAVSSIYCLQTDLEIKRHCNTKTAVQYKNDISRKKFWGFPLAWLLCVSILAVHWCHWSPQLVKHGKIASNQQQFSHDHNMSRVSVSSEAPSARVLASTNRKTVVRTDKHRTGPRLQFGHTVHNNDNRARDVRKTENRFGFAF